MRLDLHWRPTKTEDGRLSFDQTPPYPYNREEIEKSGVISPAFGSTRRRRNQLVQRLKRRRNYKMPVKGGEKKKRRKRGHMGGQLTSGRSATTLKGMTTLAKHPGPGGSEVHSTGTDQTVHTPHTTSGKAADDTHHARMNFDWNEEYYRAWANLPELGEHQYWTRPSKMEFLQKEIDRLNRRGQRYLGIPESEGLKIVPLDLTHAHTASDGRVIAFQAFEIQGTPPEAPGFEFMAKIEHLQNEDGSYTNILKANPNFEGQIPTEYRNAGPNCDICKRNIYRKETFLVHNLETGEVVQAGRDDLALYTGFREADQLANYTSAYSDFVAALNEGDPEGFGGGGGPLTFNARDALAVTASLTRQEGFIPASSYSGTPTKQWLAEVLHHPEKLPPQMRHLLPEDQDYDKAEKVYEWLQSLEDEDLANDYMWNLKTAVTNPYGVDSRQYGIVASAVNAYDREMGLRVERQRRADIDAVSDWVGEVKVRQDFPNLTITRHNSFEGNYGLTHVYEFVDENDNSIVWFASNPLSRTVPNVELAQQDAEFRAEGKRLFEEKVVPAGGSIEGMVAVMGHTAGTRDLELKEKWVAEGRITPEIEQRAREIWYGGQSFGEYKDFPELVYQGHAGEKNRIQDYVRSIVFPEVSEMPMKEVDLEPGDKVSLKATVKEHKTDTFNGRNRKQTVITRGTIIE